LRVGIIQNLNLIGIQIGLPFEKGFEN
jgi:hypothetical protein